jgi:Asp-tRNA(Asn)/Glu-tRNA(Gln) amidotransferase A subunit family amidase
MGDAELTYLPAATLARMVRERAVSATEVVAAHLDRIAAVNPSVNAVVALGADAALAGARRADERLACGEEARPLEGVPFTVKDNIEAAGLTMAIGAPERAGAVPQDDAPVVARLRAAGAILLGKTNCPPWGGGIETENPVYGRTANPYDLERTPGGSSGGDLRGIRVALCTDDGLIAPGADTVAAVRAAAAALGAAGAAVEDARYPRGGHELTLDIWRSYGAGVSAAELYGVLRRWDAFRAAMLAFGERHDLIVCPVFPSPAPSHGAIKQPGRIDPTSYTTPFSTAGWPAATVRCAASAERLPIGVQLVAAPWRDDLALAAALAVESARGGWAPPPL